MAVPFCDRSQIPCPLLAKGTPPPQQDVVFVEVVLAQVAIMSENSSALQSYRVVY